MNFWQGKSIRLRAIEPGDAEYFYRWNLDSERARSLDYVWPPSSRTSIQAWVEEKAQHKSDGDQFHWMIENLAGERVGSISTHACNPRDGTFSYGIDIAIEHRRQGYAKEAIFLVLRYYFEELRYQKVTVSIHADNNPSIRLHEQLGFQQEGAIRRAVFTQGRHVDALWFGMTAEEFQDSLREH